MANIRNKLLVVAAAVVLAVGGAISAFAARGGSNEHVKSNVSHQHRSAQSGHSAQGKATHGQPSNRGQLRKAEVHQNSGPSHSSGPSTDSTSADTSTVDSTST